MLAKKDTSLSDKISKSTKLSKTLDIVKHSINPSLAFSVVELALLSISSSNKPVVQNARKLIKYYRPRYSGPLVHFLKLEPNDLQ